MTTTDELKQQRLDALIRYLDQASIDAQRASEKAIIDHMQGYFAGHRDAFALAAKWIQEIVQCQP